MFSALVNLFSSSSTPRNYSSQSAMAVKDDVETIIAGSKIAFFSKSWCPYCTRAKGLLQKEYPGVEVKITELDEVEGGDDIQAYLHQKTGQRSVPNIFINQKHIGGCDDLHALQNKGELSKLVTA